MKASNKLLFWIFFSVSFSIAPIGFSLWKLYSEKNPLTLIESLKKILIHGELILVCIPLLSAAIGELFQNTYRRNHFHSFLGAISIMLLYFSTATFVDISSSLALGVSKDQDFVFWSSLSIFTSTFLVGLAVIVSTKENKLSFGRIYE